VVSLVVVEDPERTLALYDQAADWWSFGVVILAFTDRVSFCNNRGLVSVNIDRPKRSQEDVDRFYC
jgi:hypothetical protein